MRSVSRRTFLKHSSIAAAMAPWVGGSVLKAGLANERVNIACIGVGGKGGSDLHETSAGHNIVALCDTDANFLARASEKFPGAKTYTDWMLRGTAIPNASCDTAAVERNVALGRELRINGTPTIFFADGTRVPGAVDAERLEALLKTAKAK